MFNKHCITLSKQMRNALPQRGDEMFIMYSCYYYTVALQEILTVKKGNMIL